MAVGLRTSPPAHLGVPALELVGVGRVFGNRVALSPLSLSIARGTVTVVTGANGAGKTTLLRVAAGLLSPTSGTRQAAGRSFFVSPGSAARTSQTVAQAVQFVGHFARDAQRHDVMVRLGLEGLDDARVATLSAGQRARLSLLIALTLAAPVTCLDEPTAHVDDTGASVVRDAVVELASSGSAVLLATHNPDLFAPIADARLHLTSGAVVETP